MDASVSVFVARRFFSADSVRFSFCGVPQEKGRKNRVTTTVRFKFMHEYNESAKLKNLEYTVF